MLLKRKKPLFSKVQKEIIIVLIALIIIFSVIAIFDISTTAGFWVGCLIGGAAGIAVISL